MLLADHPLSDRGRHRGRPEEDEGAGGSALPGSSGSQDAPDGAARLHRHDRQPGGEGSGEGKGEESGREEGRGRGWDGRRERRNGETASARPSTRLGGEWGREGRGEREGVGWEEGETEWRGCIGTTVNQVGRGVGKGRERGGEREGVGWEEGETEWRGCIGTTVNQVGRGVGEGREVEREVGGGDGMGGLYRHDREPGEEGRGRGGERGVPWIGTGNGEGVGANEFIISALMSNDRCESLNF